MDQKTFTLIAGVIFAVVALLHLLRVYMAWPVIIGGWTVPGKLDCFRRSGRLELLRIKTPHAASLIAASCPCCAALKIGSKCLCWVNKRQIAAVGDESALTSTPGHTAALH